MSANSNNIINLTIKQFPQNLLLPKENNIVLLQVTNLSNKEEKLKLEFIGENLNISVNPDIFKNEIAFNAGEQKDITLSLEPVTDGFGKLIINIYLVKLVQYTVKVQKVREKISTSRIKKILKSKDFLPLEIKDNFKAEDYIKSASKNDVKNLEKQIKSVENNQTSISDIDALKRQLAISYLSVDDFYKALETALQLSSEKEKVTLYYNLVRAYASKNIESVLNIAKSLGDKERKNQLLRNIAMDYPQQFSKISTLFDDEELKQDVIIAVIGKAASSRIDIALRLTELIKDEVIKVKILFHLIKLLYEKKNQAQILKLINDINQIILSSPRLDQTNPKNLGYQLFKESILVVAELDSPIAANTIINDIKVEELKQNVIKDLFDDIYVMVDEIRTKLESKTVSSQYFMLNTFVSKVSPEIKDFSLVGGNVSNNLLIGDYNFKLALISLFKFDFSIFPILDRIYMDLQANSNKSFAYYIYPSISNHENDEVNIIKKSLSQFFSPQKLANTVILLNLDFIPYLGRPTIIISSEDELLGNLNAKIQKGMNQKADVIVDDSMFKGGESVETLKNVFYGHNFKLANLVLSYEFLNDYDALKMFIQSLI